MTNSTDVYWDVDGVSLQTFAHNIVSLGGERDSVPPWRGSDRVFAYAAGASPRPMVADSRTVSLLMWVNGCNDDGSAPGGGAAIAYQENRRALKRLFWKPDGATFDLTKRWRDSAGVHYATATGRVNNSMATEMHGPHGSAFVVDVFLPDPWFYGDWVTTVLASGVSQVIENDGDDTCRTMTLNLEGVWHDPVLTNYTPTQDMWMKATTDVGAGDSVLVDVGEERVRRDSDGANLIGTLTHIGDRSWMAFGRGASSIACTGSAGSTGVATLNHRPAYF